MHCIPEHEDEDDSSYFSLVILQRGGESHHCTNKRKPLKATRKRLSHAHLTRTVFTIGLLRRSCDPLSALNTAGTFKDTLYLYYSC